MKHTPGPWTFHHNGDGSYSILGEKISEKEYKWISAFIQNGEIWNETQLANAKLIAAAPDLLKELQHIVERINTVAIGAVGSHVSEAFCQALRDRAVLAIKKATE